MSSKHFNECCTLIVRDNFGRLPGKIYHALTIRGRSSGPDLGRYCGLRLRHIKQALAILIQHSLVHFSTANHSQKAILYEVVNRNAFALLRQGRYSRLIEQRYGSEAAKIFEYTATNGVVTAGELGQRQTRSLTNGSQTLDNPQAREAAMRKSRETADSRNSVDLLTPDSTIVEPPNRSRLASKTNGGQAHDMPSDTKQAELQHNQTVAEMVRQYLLARHQEHDSGTLHDREEAFEAQAKQECETSGLRGKFLKDEFQQRLDNIRAKYHEHAGGLVALADLDEQRKLAYSRKRRLHEGNTQKITQELTSFEERRVERPGHQNGLTERSTQGNPNVIETAKRTRKDRVHDARSNNNPVNVNAGKRKLPYKSEGVVDQTTSMKKPKLAQDLRQKHNVIEKGTERADISISHEGVEFDSGVSAVVPLNGAESITYGPALRNNHFKIDVFLRSTLLVSMVKRKLGTATSNVFAAALQNVDTKYQRCRGSSEDGRQVTTSITTKSVAKACRGSIVLMPPGHNKNKGIKAESVTTLRNGHREQDRWDEAHPSTTGNEALEPGHESSCESKEGIERSGYDVFSIEEESDDARLELVRRHLNILADDPTKFVLRETRINRRPEDCTWNIDVESLSRLLTTGTIEEMIVSRFKTPALAIYRILKEKGRMEEKHIANFTLTRVKDMRAFLIPLRDAGLINTQEIPKDNARQPLRTVYLWFRDEERAHDALARDAYKTIARILQRLRHVKKRKAFKKVLEKASRTDVIGNESKFLNKRELATLNVWLGIHHNAHMLLSRLDETIAILRDF